MEGREVAAASLLVMILRLVSKYRLHAGFELLSNIDNEAGAGIVIKRRINNLERTVRREGDFTQIAQACQEAGLITERGGIVMIGMASLPIGQNEHARARLADDPHDLHQDFVVLF